MGQLSEWEGIKLDTPATYRIRVQGLLDSSWSDRLGGMAINRIEDERKLPVTMLVGYLADQTALAGVLNALYDLRMPLLSVENLDEK